MEIKKSFFKENWLLFVAIIYMLLPVDFIPDVIPVLGQVDDSLVILIDLLTRYNDFRKRNKPAAETEEKPLKRVDDETFSEED